MFYRAILLTMAVSFLAPPGYASDPEKIPAGENVTLVFTRMNWPIALTARTRISSPPALVWQVLTDYDHLSDILPQMASSRVVGRSEDGILVEQATESQFLFLRKKITVLLNISERRNQEISFFRVAGNMDLFSGKWILIETEGGKSTELTYQLEFKPAFYAPKWLVRHSLSREVPEQLRLIADRIGTLDRK